MLMAHDHQHDDDIVVDLYYQLIIDVISIVINNCYNPTPSTADHDGYIDNSYRHSFRFRVLS